MELIPEIRKYYSFNGIKAVGEPNKIKRSWLSIIKHLIKLKYNIVSLDYHLPKMEIILEHRNIILIKLFNPFLYNYYLYQFLIQNYLDKFFLF